MITIYIDYQGPRSIETERFSDFNDFYLKKIAEIESNKAMIDGVKIFQTQKISDKSTHKSISSVTQWMLVNTTNASIAVRKARALASVQTV